MTIESPLAESLTRWQRRALGVACAGGVLMAVGYTFNADRFFQAYLVAFLYLWTTAMGCLGLALIYQMTGGRWGYATRPFFEAGARTLPLLALAFVPVGLGLKSLYVWTDPNLFHGDPHAVARAWYLTENFFLSRSVGYVLVAGVIGVGISQRFKRAGPETPRRAWPTLAALTMVVAVLLVTFAVADWGMSLDPYWYSTMYGAIFIAGGLLLAMCLVTAGVALSVERLATNAESTLNLLNDLGNLILAFLMVWAYLSLSQFLIIYAGNLPVEVQWYLPRLAGGWEFVAIVLVVLHFFVPFFLLLSRDIKRHARRLAWAAMGIALIHLIEVYWVVMPTFAATGIAFQWLDLVVPAALGALFLFDFLRHLKPRLLPLVAVWPHAEKGTKAHG